MEEAAAAIEERRRSLGEKIKEARLAKNWKQKNLAAAVHVEPDTVSRWERGQHAPDFEMMELIADALGRPLSFFVSGEDAEATLGGGSARWADLLARIEELSRQQEQNKELLAELLRLAQDQ